MYTELNLEAYHTQPIQYAKYTALNLQIQELNSTYST